MELWSISTTTTDRSISKLTGYFSYWPVFPSNWPPIGSCTYQVGLKCAVPYTCNQLRIPPTRSCSLTLFMNFTPYWVSLCIPTGTSFWHYHSNFQQLSHPPTFPSMCTHESQSGTASCIFQPDIDWFLSQTDRGQVIKNSKKQLSVAF